MKPFALIRPDKLLRARELVEGQSETSALRAGGIDLLDRMKEGLDELDLLVELRGIESLMPGAENLAVKPMDSPNPHDDLWQAPHYARIAALTTLAELAAAELPGAEALLEAAGQAATPSIRNTATVSGNLLQRPRCWYFRRQDLLCLKKGGDTCLALTGDNRYHAILGGGPSFIVHPSSLATALTALDASAEIYRGPDSLVAAEGEPPRQDRRLLGMHDLFVGPQDDPMHEHTLDIGDILIAVYLPVIEGMRSAYQAVREKQSHDWPLVEAAARMRLDPDGTMRDVRIALGHVAPVPWLASAAAERLEGQTPDAALFAAAAEVALSGATPLDGNGYKVPMSKGLLREVLHRASGLALPE